MYVFRLLYDSHSRLQMLALTEMSIISYVSRCPLQAANLVLTLTMGGKFGTFCHLVEIRTGYHSNTSQCKGKAVPLQAWSDPECSRKMRFPDYMTTQDGGKFVSLTHWPPLPPRK
jgi:hypothetical protein